MHVEQPGAIEIQRGCGRIACQCLHRAERSELAALHGMGDALAGHRVHQPRCIPGEQYGPLPRHGAKIPHRQEMAFYGAGS